MNLPRMISRSVTGEVRSSSIVPDRALVLRAQRTPRARAQLHGRSDEVCPVCRWQIFDGTERLGTKRTIQSLDERAAAVELGVEGARRAEEYRRAVEVEHAERRHDPLPSEPATGERTIELDVRGERVE